MFKRSNSEELFFLWRETYSKENAQKLIFFHEYGNCFTFQCGKGEVTHTS